MPSQYYATVCFRISLAGYFLLLMIELLFWYNTVTVAGPGAWVPLSAYILLGFILVFFPGSPGSQGVQLPAPFIPLVMLLTLVLTQFMLDMLPHNLTAGDLVLPLMVISLICAILVQRHPSPAPWFLLFYVFLLIIKWHAGIFISRTALATEFLPPVMMIYASYLFKRQIEEANHKARQSRVLLKNTELAQEAEADISSVAARRVEEVRRLTEDMLHRIAYHPEPVTEDEVRDFRFTEAQLRDTIRGRHIVNSEILEAAFIARQRGVKVDILDERGEPLPPALSTLLTVCAVDLLDSATAGTITIRALPIDDPTALMLVHDGNSEDDEPSAIEISPDGTVDRF